MKHFGYLCNNDGVGIMGKVVMMTENNGYFYDSNIILGLTIPNNVTIDYNIISIVNR